MKDEVLLWFSMYPHDKGESLSKYVARSLDIIDRSGVKYKTGPMGTTLEGDYDTVMAVMKECFETMNKDCNRIGAVMKIDYRKNSSGRLDGKTASLEKKLGRELEK